MLIKLVQQLVMYHTFHTSPISPKEFTMFCHKSNNNQHNHVLIANEFQLLHKTKEIRNLNKTKASNRQLPFDIGIGLQTI